MHGSCFLFSMIFMGKSLGLRRGPEVDTRHCFRVLPFGAAILVGLVVLSMLQNAGAYVLENKSWPPESTITLQLGLGTPSHSLQDGSPTWDAAVASVLSMWNQQVQRIHLNGVVNPSAPVATGDGVNSIVFSSTIFGQNFGSGTLAITYYRSQGATLVEADVTIQHSPDVGFLPWAAPIRTGFSCNWRYSPCSSARTRARLGTQSSRFRRATGRGGDEFHGWRPGNAGRGRYQRNPIVIWCSGGLLFVESSLAKQPNRRAANLGDERNSS